MPTQVESILKIEVPIIVQIGERTMRLSEVLDLVPGSIVELPKSADDELELLVNNKVIGTGEAVKVSENFGIRVQFVGDRRDRVKALGAGGRERTPGASASEAGTAPAEADDPADDSLVDVADQVISDE